MFVAQSLAVITFPLPSRLPADLASAKRLICGDSDSLAHGLIPATVHVEAQAAELLLHLQHLEGDSSFLLSVDVSVRASVTGSVVWITSGIGRL
jgi:hypothetical protein